MLVFLLNGLLLLDPSPPTLLFHTLLRALPMAEDMKPPPLPPPPPLDHEEEDEDPEPEAEEVDPPVVALLPPLVPSFLFMVKEREGESLVKFHTRLLFHTDCGGLVRFPRFYSRANFTQL